MPDERDVARHYDVLDEAYRRVWGEHVHHGLWTTGDEAPEDAAVALAEHVADAARVTAGDRVCDVGCGYGATARLLAGRGAQVTGLTLSAAQAAAAPATEGVQLLVRSWLENGLPDASFDAVVAIESLSHMTDKPRAFAELGRVVRPGGRVVLTDWLTRERPGPVERRTLLDPICREGHLPSMHPASEYAAWLRASGLHVVGFEDLSARTWMTWVVVARRIAALPARDPALLRELLSARNPDRRFGFSLARIPIALRTGAMRLGMLVAERR